MVSILKAIMRSINYLEDDLNPEQVEQLEVIAIGLPRTGTSTLKLALIKLGYNPYHQGNVFADPQKMKSWKNIVNVKYSLRERYGVSPLKWYSDNNVINANNIDFNRIYYQYGFDAAVCLPTYLIYKEILQKYPNMKVILTEREPEKWYSSVSTTIGAMRPIFDRWFARLLLGKDIAWLMDAFFELIADGKVGKDKDFVIKQYNEWNDMVKSTVPKEQLLIFHPKQGWEPLCKFLDKPVPNEPFPKSNSKQVVINLKSRLNAVHDMIDLCLLIGIGFVVYRVYKNESYKLVIEWITIRSS